MQEQSLDFALISKAIQTTYEKLKEDSNTNDKSLDHIMEAEKNLNQALSFHLQFKL